MRIAVKKKFSAQLIISVFIILIVTSTGLVLYSQRENKLINRPSEAKTVVAEPTANPVSKLKSGYEVKPHDSEWDVLESSDFGMNMRIPEGSQVAEGGGSEVAQLGVVIPTSLGNAVVVIDTGFKLSSDLFSLVEQQANEDGLVPFSYSQPKEKIINNASGYEFTGTYEGVQVYHFFTETNDRYIHMWYYYPWAGSELTGKEGVVVKEMISSFKLL